MTFLNITAMDADKVYLLGDLFEYWIGDDAAPLLGVEPILQQMKKLAGKVECYFIAGNRDFLVGKEFSEHSGFKILPDETVIDLYGTPTLILHGDSLCTDDIPHQEFRKQMVTNKEWRESFLELDIPSRIEQAKQARMQSHDHKASISMEIMDVSESAVIDTFNSKKVDQMIHGHTHRQNKHDYILDDQKSVTRFVLGDWHKTTSILIASENGRICIENAEI